MPGMDSRASEGNAFVRVGHAPELPSVFILGCDGHDSVSLPAEGLDQRAAEVVEIPAAIGDDRNLHTGRSSTSNSRMDRSSSRSAWNSRASERLRRGGCGHRFTPSNSAAKPASPN